MLVWHSWQLVNAVVEEALEAGLVSVDDRNVNRPAALR
jgi:hypothetical protein